jgi:hypothetical protein
VRFVSLQRDAGGAEAAGLQTEQPLLDLGAEIHDFADSAAIIGQLDLVICVDTAIAHLAGALGKPCWILLPFVGSDWRWLSSRQDSPWYPGHVRLFRQSAPGDWTPVVATLANALRDFASSPRPREH